MIRFSRKCLQTHVGVVILLFCFIQTQAQSLVLRNVMPVDVLAGKAGSASDVWIDNGTIRAIRPHSPEWNPAPESENRDATGQYLVPGFADAHIHFFQSGGLYTRPDAIDLRAFRPYEQEMAETRASSLDFMRRYLASGITTVCDVGGPMSNYEIRDESLRRDTTPNVVITGPLISTYVPAAFQIDDPPIIKVSSPEEAVELVRKQLPFKPDLIKIWFIVFPGQSPDDSRPMVRAVVQESHKAGLPVAVHATELETARVAVEEGADILVHSVRDQLVDEEFIALLLENEVSYVPTLIVGRNYSLAFGKKPLVNPAELAIANPFFLGSLLDLRHLPASALPSWMSRLPAMGDRDAQEMAIMQQNLKRLYDAGVNVVTGTDAGNLGTQHASSYFTEWLAMREAGLSSAEVLRASTWNAARMLGRQGSSGSISPGMTADLVLLDSNPLDSLPMPENIRGVVRQGQWLGNMDDLLPVTPEILAQRQLNAYNTRNLEAFLDCYADSVELYNFPDQLVGQGKERMRQTYSTMFEQVTDLHCELLNRIVVGNRVIDEERVTGFSNGRILHVSAIYEVQDGLIRKVWFVRE